MGEFCLFAELHRKGSTINWAATPSFLVQGPTALLNLTFISVPWPVHLWCGVWLHVCAASSGRVILIFKICYILPVPLVGHNRGVQEAKEPRHGHCSEWCRDWPGKLIPFPKLPKLLHLILLFLSCYNTSL